jgi:hypothetical protein
MEVSGFLVLAALPKQFCAGCGKEVHYEQKKKSPWSPDEMTTLVAALAKKMCSFFDDDEEIGDMETTFVREEIIPLIMDSLPIREVPTPESNASEYMGALVCHVCVPK